MVFPQLLSHSYTTFCLGKFPSQLRVVSLVILNAPVFQVLPSLPENLCKTPVSPASFGKELHRSPPSLVLFVQSFYVWTWFPVFEWMVLAPSCVEKDMNRQPEVFSAA